MQLTKSQKASLYYYNWDYLSRAYYHFAKPVQLEPPFVPFAPKVFLEESIDDGRVPSLLSQLKGLFHHQDLREEASLEIVVDPVLDEDQSPLSFFSLSFPKDTKQEPRLWAACISNLSFSYERFSFEIFASSERISIHIVCSSSDTDRIRNQIQGFFPSAVLLEQRSDFLSSKPQEIIGIVDFGLEQESVRPLARPGSFDIDPLTPLFASLNNLRQGETILLQIIIKGVVAPWGASLRNSVSDGAGGSFFVDSPEMLRMADEKTTSPLFSAVLRIVIQSGHQDQSKGLALDCIRSIERSSQSGYNQLIALSSEGYDYDQHLENVYQRKSNRLGFLVNAEELANFFHYPNRTLVSSKLRGSSYVKSKGFASLQSKGLYLGNNTHEGVSAPVHLNTESRLSHTHIIGATGVGKSTLIANMVLQDIKSGLGCAVFDPHGDIVEDILKRIPKHRVDDVVLVDPSDIEHPIGFNVLEAQSEEEKIVLSSDIIYAFKQHANAWGDTMTSVLSNALNTILESSKGGTLFDLKRLLLEERFRKAFLENVSDPQLHYYWKREYPMVRKGIAPLLTRIDTFLRPKLVRYMLAQKSGVHIPECVRENKVVLLKLSQGLIGESNSYLLGSLFLAKFNQAALARQSQAKEKRTPYFLYLDEFHNFITPSIISMLAGSRKYRMGLVLAHQELSQIQDTTLLNSIISNPYTRICFRLGDTDAKRLALTFSSFEAIDFQSLERGDALVRLGVSTNDGNLHTEQLKDLEIDYTDHIISKVRKSYTRSKTSVEEELYAHFSGISSEGEKVQKPQEGKVENRAFNEKAVVPESNASFESEKRKYLESQSEKEEERKHINLQNYVKTVAQQRGFKVSVEEPLDDGGRVDVGLARETFRIAVEISVTNSIDYEVQNIQKCLDADYMSVCMVCENKRHLENIKNKALKEVSKKHHPKLHFISPKAFIETLEAIMPQKESTEKRVKGYRVKTSYRSKSDDAKQNSIGQFILQSLRKERK